MINRRLTTGGLAIVLLIGLSVRVTHGAAGQQNRNDREGQYGGSLDARQHGYEHAYRDGADRGRQDRDRRTGYSLKKNDYQSSARGYEAFFGDRGQYIQGAREGYKAGYNDGYNGRASRYGQIYGRPNGTNQASVPDDVYAARAWAPRIWPSTSAIVTESRPASRIKDATRARTTGTPTHTETPILATVRVTVTETHTG